MTEWAAIFRSLLDTLADLERRGASALVPLSQYLDTTRRQFQFGVQMMGAVAELERELIREQTRAGIMAAAKARGSKVGGAKEATPERIEKARQLILAGSSYKEAAAAVGLAVNTIYRDLPGGVRAVRDAAKIAA